MAEGSRRPLVVLGILAVLAVALFGFGVAAGPRGADAEWPDPFGSFRPGDALRPDELTVESGACAVGDEIAFTSGCVLAVAPVEGGWPWQRVTRTARLVAKEGPVRVSLVVQGEPLRTDLKPGKDVRLVFTADGGRLGLACLGLGGCRVALAEDGP